MGRLRFPEDAAAPVRILVILTFFGVAYPRALAALARAFWSWLAP